MAVASVLLVEDDRALVRTWSRVLCARGHEVAPAITLERARELLAADPPPGFDVVLLDLVLPDGDGETLLPFVRALAAAPRVGVISSHYDGVRAVELQGRCNAAIPKPVPNETLCAFVEVLSRGRVEATVREFGELFGFTRTEALLLEAAAQGLSASECGVALELTLGAVYQYWHRIFDKTGHRTVRSVLGSLFRYAIDGGRLRSD